jgi:hypothetical protein
MIEEPPLTCPKCGRRIVMVPLTRGKRAIVAEESYELVSKHKWCANPDGRGFWRARTKIDGRFAYMHRFLLIPKPGEEIHHIDGNELNNCLCNLEIVFRLQHRTRPKITGQIISKIRTGKAKDGEPTVVKEES